MLVDIFQIHSTRQAGFEFCFAAFQFLDQVDVQIFVEYWGCAVQRQHFVPDDKSKNQ
jgi:hypothetical protein